MSNKEYYSPKEIAETYNLNIRTVYAWIRQGRLKAIKLGDLWRIPKDSLDDFLKESLESENE